MNRGIEGGPDWSIELGPDQSGVSNRACELLVEPPGSQVTGSPGNPGLFSEFIHMNANRARFLLLSMNVFKIVRRFELANRHGGATAIR